MSNIPFTQTDVEREHSEALDTTVGKVKKPETSGSRRPDMELDDVFSFGKYRGKRTLEYVIEHDPRYIDWLTENEVVYFTEEAYEYQESLREVKGTQ